MVIKNNSSKGFVITHPDSHERGTVCFTPLATTKNCECPNAEWYVDRNSKHLNELPDHLEECAGDANDSDKSGFLMRPNELYKELLTEEERKQYNSYQKL